MAFTQGMSLADTDSMFRKFYCGLVIYQQTIHLLSSLHKDRGHLLHCNSGFSKTVWRSKPQNMTWLRCKLIHLYKKYMEWVD